MVNGVDGGRGKHKGETAMRTTRPNWDQHDLVEDEVDWAGKQNDPAKRDG